MQLKVPCNISARFHSLTEMSRDRNGLGRLVPLPKRPRLKRLDRNGHTEMLRTIVKQLVSHGSSQGRREANILNGPDHTKEPKGKPDATDKL